mgnify:CR=1 FL=1
MKRFSYLLNSNNGREWTTKLQTQKSPVTIIQLSLILLLLKIKRSQEDLANSELKSGSKIEERLITSNNLNRVVAALANYSE